MSWNISSYINVYFVYHLRWQVWYIYIYIYIAQFNNNSNKKNFQTHGFNPTQPNPCGLGWTYVIGWVGSKNPLNPTHVLVNFPTPLKKNYFSSFVPLIFQELSCNNFPTYLKKLLVMTFNFFFLIIYLL